MEQVKQQQLAPICLFTYNRLELTKKTVEALQKNYLAPESQLIIFSDGPKKSDDFYKINSVREYLKTITGFRSIEIIESNVNKGLANSIIEGVTKIVNQYGKIIVLEDNLITSAFFLTFMNESLFYYQNDNAVFQVSGFMFPINPTGLPDTFYYQANTCWGWGTWSRAWCHFEANTNVISEELKNKKISIKKFNSMQGLAFTMQLWRNKKQKINTWPIKWHASIILNDAKVVHPRQSLISNIGLDGKGTNSKKETIAIELNNRWLDVTAAKLNDQNDTHLLAIDRLKHFFKQRFSLLAILKRKLS